MPDRSHRKYRKVIEAFYASPWAITPERYESLVEVIQMRRDGEHYTREEIEARIGDRRQADQASSATGSILQLNVFGVLSQRMNLMTEMSGGTSMEMLGQAIDRGAADDNVSAIVMNIDSPGGSANFIAETAEKIVAATARKPVIAVSNSLAASGAYWLMVAATEAVVTPSGMVGSVGVITSHEDHTKAQEDLGVKVQVIRKPDNKAEGAFGQPLSEGALAHLEALVDTIYGEFVGFVAAQRNVSTATIRELFGRVYTAERAVELGMVDRIATLDSILADLGLDAAPSDRPAFSLEGWNMNPQLFGALVRAGMCDITASESEAASALTRFCAAKGIEANNDDLAIEALLDHAKGPVAAPAVADEPVTDENRASQIMAAVRLASFPESVDTLEFAQNLIASNATLPQAIDQIQNAVAAGPVAPTPVIAPIDSQQDKFMESARDAVLVRSTFSGRKPSQVWSMTEQDYVPWKPEAAVRSRSLQSLPRLAETCLEQSGYDRSRLDRLSTSQVVQLAMGLIEPGSLGIRMASDGPSYNVSGMFNDILLDASNVSARDSYNEASTTFQVWARQAESIPDFKTVNRIISGEIGDPRAIPEDGEFEESTLSDTRETYKLVVWGSVFSLTWQAAVNDELGEFMKIQSKQGAAMRRKQNKLVYAILADNAAMADGTALFHADHSNNDTGAVTDYTAELNAMRQRLAEQTGLNTDTVLGLDPKYILYPPAIAGDVEQLLASSANPAVGGSAAGSSGVANIWRGRLEPVTDGQMGNAQGGSDTAFFLATDPNDVDTIEYAYLQGLETPALDRVEAFDRLGVKHRIYQAFATKAIDHRGLQRHTGV